MMEDTGGKLAQTEGVMEDSAVSASVSDNRRSGVVDGIMSSMSIINSVVQTEDPKRKSVSIYNNPTDLCCGISDGIFPPKDTDSCCSKFW